MLRALSRDLLEILMETRKIRKPALKTQLLDANPVIYKQLTRMPHPDLRQKLRVRLPGTGFEVTTKGVWHEPRHRRHFFQVDLLGEMTERIIINGIDPVILHL